MRLAIGLAFVALVLVAITPHAGGAPLEGRTPKGVKYRFEQRPKVREIAVSYMFRDPSLATPQGFGNVSYGHPAALVGGSAGEERETVLRKLCEAQVQSGTIVPFRGFMGGTLVFPADKLDLAGAVLADVFQKPRLSRGSPR